ncbi:CinA family protein [Polaromonas sp.]|uniref:CinA family protein n=1 Tax=Polaromonas sp. TaxID=1869339 RepID=UPI0032678B9B
MSNTPLKEVAGFMAAHSLVLATAESCTAGLIAAHLAEVPGAGELLESACITYSPDAKQQRLGVKPETIARFNLTSEQVAGEMAQGVLRNSQANLAIANTGVTDDTDPAIPAGTQCFAWLFAGRNGQAAEMFTETRRFTGERNEIREQAARHALSKIPVYYAALSGKVAPAKEPANNLRNLRAQAVGSS